MPNQRPPTPHKKNKSARRMNSARTASGQSPEAAGPSEVLNSGAPTAQSPASQSGAIATPTLPAAPSQAVPPQRTDSAAGASPSSKVSPQKESPSKRSTPNGPNLPDKPSPLSETPPGMPMNQPGNSSLQQMSPQRITPGMTQTRIVPTAQPLTMPLMQQQQPPQQIVIENIPSPQRDAIPTIEPQGLYRRLPHPASESSDNLVYQQGGVERTGSKLTVNTSSDYSGATSELGGRPMLPFYQPPVVLAPGVNRYSPTNPGLEAGTSNRGKKGTMIRAERINNSPRQQNILAPSEKKGFDGWQCYVSMVTCCCWTSCLRIWMLNPQVQQAWREKIALCSICFILCAILGYITFGLQKTICPGNYTVYAASDIKNPSKVIYENAYIIHGTFYNFKNYIPKHNSLPYFRTKPDEAALIASKTGKDISPYFPRLLSSACTGVLKPFQAVCKTPDFPDTSYCHNWNSAEVQSELSKARLGPVTYSWSEVRSTPRLMVYKASVLDMTDFLQNNQSASFPPDTRGIVQRNINLDSSYDFGGNENLKKTGDCLQELYSVGVLEDKPTGCFISDVILYVSLIIILSVVFIRFVLAIAFSWFLSRKLGKLQKDFKQSQGTRKTILAEGKVPFPMFHQGEWNAGTGIEPSPDRLTPLKPKKFEKLPNSQNKNRNSIDFRRFNKPFQKKSKSAYGKELHTIMLVTCYSEGEEGLRTTFDSLAMTQYSEDFKLLFIVADGMITGSGNKKSTPDLIIDMLEMDKSWPLPPPALSYFSLAEGSKEHNKAQVYAAWYNVNGRSVPTILVVKSGTEEEALAAKPGNRGKRDSQMILMRFLQKVNFNERMCPLEYELFQKIHYLMGVTPDRFEIILMVDADTQVAHDSLARMVACMAEDPKIMGLCGDTRIANKSESWVSRIQVFEYFVSQHLNKAFESIFGNVTCLPGCFCMYRIKAPKGDGYWVPILTNPDIINTYSEKFVDTLHKKNLLLLGEDRFLTTLMLRTFPRRKLIFVPRAYCKTTVPAQFKVLLSQRRRWINSTIHNLLELVMVRELCGVFCFSMQFVIILELIGTVTLPAAIIFTMLLVITSIVGNPEIIPLMLLAAILGLPAILILFTTRRVVYIYWMIIYLLALPIWNFVLPVYAFWHFDDFSWGATRQVHGEGKDKGHGYGGGAHLQSGVIPLKKWADWERERRLGFKQRA